MRRMLFVSCGLLFLLGTLSCAQLGLKPEPLGPVFLSGSQDNTSHPFQVNTKEWQIKWKYEAAAERGYNFVLYVYPEGDDVNYTEMVVSPPLPESSGSTYLYKGKGRFYVKVRAKKIAKWEVEVVRAGIGKSIGSPASFSGTADTTTQPFMIEGKEFIIYYAMEPKGSWAGQMIAVYRRGETENFLDATTVGPGTGSKVFEGPGEYYLKVQCTGVQEWKITVTE